MVVLTEPVVRLIRHPDTSKVLATVSPAGEPLLTIRILSCLLLFQSTLPRGSDYLFS